MQIGIATIRRVALKEEVNRPAQEGRARSRRLLAPIKLVKAMTIPIMSCR